MYPYGITAVINVDRHVSDPTIITLADDELAVQTNVAEFQNFLNSQTYLRFQQRRSDIERQVTFIFVYPAVYVFLYAFPITQQFIYYNSQGTTLLTKEVINYIADFIRPAAGAVNSLIFYWKESQSQKVLDQVDRPTSLSSGGPDRIEPDHDLNIQIESREDYSSPRSDFLSPLDTTRRGWPTSSTPSLQKSSQWAARIRNFRFRQYSEEEEKALDGTAEVKASRSMMPIREEGTYRYSREQPDR